jgi:signal peptidase I
MDQEPETNTSPGNIPTSVPAEKNTQPGSIEQFPVASSLTGLRRSYFSFGFISSAVVLIILYALAFGITQLKIVIENASSMAPTIEDGQKVITTKSYNNPRINDIVVFNQPTLNQNSVGGQFDSLQIISRVAAIPGDRVDVVNGKLTVFNPSNPKGFDPDDSDGLSSQTTNGNITLVVPTGYVFVIGDNRADSIDSREFGPIPIKSIIGKVVHNL